jgi:F-type H+-transporting ATPase subunit c
MDLTALKFIGAGIATLGMFGAALGVGNVFNALVSGIARNPSAKDAMFVPALIGAGLAEALGILSFVIGILLAL